MAKTPKPPLQHPQTGLVVAMQEMVQAMVAAELDRRGLTGLGKSPAEFRAEARQADGSPWTVAALADAVGSNHPAILRIESGQLAFMRARTDETILAIAAALGCDAGQYRAAVERQRTAVARDQRSVISEGQQQTA